MVVVGGGQAGLAVSHELTGLGVEHVVLERRRVGQTWRDRWDSFCFVTPNWTRSLPGMPYSGAEPEGFDHRDEIVRYLEGYARSFQAPVREGVAVTALAAARGGGFHMVTSDGDLVASQVVVATGAYQKPHRPPVAGAFPPGLEVIDAEGYRNPDQLGAGGVLVVGSGQTGCQLAEDLHLAGRDVFLACGRAPWGPRRVEGRDLVTWLSETDWFEMSLPSAAARLVANVTFTGRDGGHDLNYRVLQSMGVRLCGHLVGVEGGVARFAGDLANSVAFGDERYADMRRVLSEQVERAPELPDPPPFKADAPSDVKLGGLAAAIFTSGFRPDYARWVRLPVFDEAGFPLAPDGVCEAVPGLYFVGVHFLRKRKSSLMWGVGEDASIVARHVAAHAGVTGREGRRPARSRP